MQRREFLQQVGVAALAAAPQGAGHGANAAAALHERERAPKVFVYDDGRHGAPLYQYAPPLSPEDFVFSIDQLVDAGADAIVYMVGLEGGVALYDSRVAQKWGDNTKKWNHPVFYRAARHLRALIESGHDPLDLLCERAHAKGLHFIAANWVALEGGDTPQVRGHGRKSDFVYDHPQYQVGSDSHRLAEHVHPHRLSFLHEAVREERFRVYEELLARYATDGVELNLLDLAPFCRFGEVERLAPLLTAWLRRLKSSAASAAAAQGRAKRIYARIPALESAWRLFGYDVATWVRDGLVDGLVCCPGLMEAPLEHNFDLSHLVALARGTSCQIVHGFSDLLGRQLRRAATQPMVWAAAANAYAQGADGFAIVEYHWTPNGWPLTEKDHGTLRLLSHRDLLATADKLYRVRSLMRGRTEGEWLPGASSPLPQPLQTGTAVNVEMRISDDLQRWHSEGRLEEVKLRVRITSIEPSLNDVRVELNGEAFSSEHLELSDLTYRQYELGALNPYSFIYEYALPPELFPRVGVNQIAVTLLKRDPNIDVEFSVYDVDCKIRYRRHRHFRSEPLDY